MVVSLGVFVVAQVVSAVINASVSKMLALDIGAMSVYFYCFRDRDRVLDLFEMSTGQRMHTRYFQVGGVAEDIPAGWEAKARELIDVIRKGLSQYEALLDRNEIFLIRTKGIGIVERERLLELGVTGPLLRAAGEPWDLRKEAGYLVYDELDFDVPVGTVGDGYDRYRVRLAEMKNLADEILDRYASHSLGRTMLSREPFISVNRAALQTIMQDLETRVRATGLPRPPSPPATAPVPAPSNQ